MIIPKFSNCQFTAIFYSKSFILLGLQSRVGAWWWSDSLEKLRPTDTTDTTDTGLAPVAGPGSPALASLGSSLQWAASTVTSHQPGPPSSRQLQDPGCQTSTWHYSIPSSVLGPQTAAWQPQTNKCRERKTPPCLPLDNPRTRTFSWRWNEMISAT